MNDPGPALAIERPRYLQPLGNESAASAISWGAIAGGAFAAAALSLILLALGSGLGLAAVSPWENAGASAKTMGVAGAIWLAIMQIVSAGVGGYVAGRLRTKWVDVHNDEVYFRDTAHGFIVWAVGIVMTAAFLTSAGSALVGGTAKVGAAALAAGGGAMAAAQPAAGPGNNAQAADPTVVLVDRLLRREPASAAGAPAAASTAVATTPGGTPAGADSAATTASAETGPVAQVGPREDMATRAELGRMFTIAMRDGQLQAGDRAYAARIVAARTGMSQADAEHRVDEIVAQAKMAGDEARAAADTARRAAAYFSLWVFVSMLIGAFCASYAATLGGRRRDLVPV
jgi:hypothetical protein